MPSCNNQVLHFRFQPDTIPQKERLRLNILLLILSLLFSSVTSFFQNHEHGPSSAKKNQFLNFSEQMHIPIVPMSEKHTPTVASKNPPSTTVSSKIKDTYPMIAIAVRKILRFFMTSPFSLLLICPGVLYFLFKITNEVPAKRIPATVTMMDTIFCAVWFA